MPILQIEVFNVLCTLCIRAVQTAKSRICEGKTTGTQAALTMYESLARLAVSDGLILNGHICCDRTADVKCAGIILNLYISKFLYLLSFNVRRLNVAFSFLSSVASLTESNMRLNQFFRRT